MTMAVATQVGYIYCIRLPFQCTTQGTSYHMNILTQYHGLQPQPASPSSESFVAKVGITENPARTLREIYTAFQEFGEPQPILDILSSSDNPQTVIMKARDQQNPIGNIIFIEKVQYPGNTVDDICKMIVQKSVIQFGQPELNQEFLESFKAKVPEAKQHYLESCDVGIAEWIIISYPLAVDLQQKFRQGGICPGDVPSGKQFTISLTQYCDQIPFQSPSQDRLILAQSNQRLPLLFEFGALNFSHKLHCMPVMVTKHPDEEIV